MEIVPFLRLTVRRTVAIGVAAALAAAAAIAFAASRPALYSSTTSVFLDRVYNQPRFELEPKVGNFANVVLFTTVQGRVGETVGMTTWQVSDALRATVPDRGTYVDVTFTSEDPQQALLGSRTAATEALRELVNLDLANAQARLAQATEAEQSVRSAMNTLTVPLGVTNVPSAISSVEAQIASLRQSRALYGTTDTDVLRRLDDELAQTEQRLGSLQQALPEFQRIDERLNSAAAITTATQAEVDLAQVRLTIIDSEQAISLQPAIARSRVPQMLRYGLAAALGVVALACGAFMASEALRTRDDRAALAAMDARERGERLRRARESMAAFDDADVRTGPADRTLVDLTTGQ
jgi:tetratricopeptide (TPR) repeat protein